MTLAATCFFAVAMLAYAVLLVLLGLESAGLVQKETGVAITLGSILAGIFFNGVGALCAFAGFSARDERKLACVILLLLNVAPAAAIIFIVAVFAWVLFCA